MSTVVNDTFTDTAGTVLASHTGETGATWTLHASTPSGSAVISDANRLRAVNSTLTIYKASGTPASNDYAVKAYITVKSNNGEFNGPVARLHATDQTCYVVGNFSSKWQVYRVVAGASTLIVEASASTPTVGQTYAVDLEVKGTFPAVVLTLKVDGVTVAGPATDTSASAPLTGAAGVWLQGVAGSGNTVGHHFDQVTARDAIDAPAYSYSLVSADGLSIAVIFTISSSAAQLLPASGITGFTVSSGGVAANITAATRTASDTVTLTLDRALYAYERPSLAYTPGNLTDTDTNVVLAFTATDVINGSTLTPAAGASEVVLLGTQFGDAGAVGHELAKAFDGDVTTYFTAAGSEPHYVGRDAGAAVVLRRVRLTPRGGDGTTDYELLLPGTKVQGSNTSTSAGFVDLFTVPPEPYYLPRLWRNEIPLYTAATAYRYFRALEPTGSQSFIAEVEFVTDAGPASSKPVAPVISPWGGRYSAGSTTVTITSRTSTASIYYTTDGTTPTSGSTHYTAPFTLTFAAQTTLKAIAIDAGLSTTSSDVKSAVFSPWGFKPSEDLYDDRGNLIEAHDGHVLYVASAGRYYFYGAFANEANGSASADTLRNHGVWCYSSADGYNWRLEGNILANPSGVGYCMRPHVVYNASTGKYVLWAHAGPADVAIIAQADAPAGPWRWMKTSYDPNGLGLKDCNLFVDTDGTGYVVHVNSAQNKIYVSRLAADYLSTDGSDVAAYDPSGSREAPVLFKRGSTYFLLTSVSNFYDSSLTFGVKYIVCTDSTPLGTWGGGGDLDAVDPVGTVWAGQPTYVFTVPGKVDGYVYLSDHFNATALYDSRYVFRPLTFPTATTLVAGQPATWDFSTFASSAGAAARRGPGRRAGSRMAMVG